MSALIDRIIAEFTVAWGWRRIAIAIILGALAALALAPVHALPVLWISLPGLVWLLDGVAISKEHRIGGRFGTTPGAFAVGWAFGFGFFLAGLYWIGAAFLVDADRYAWALPIAIALLPAGLAIFTGLACAMAHLLRAPGYGRVLALAVAWTAAEWLRAEILTGFPWNNLGQALAGSVELLQAAAYGGDLGLTFLAVAIAAAPATLGGRSEHRSTAWGLMPALLGLVVLAGVWAAGWVRLSEAATANVPGQRIRIVQPNIPQERKWDPSFRTETLTRYLELSDAATSPQTMGINGVTHLVWPETALPVLMAHEPEILATVAALLPPGAQLITGALRAENRPDEADAAFYNSVFVIDDGGTIGEVYDKRRLVPFGEFLPFQALLERLGLRQLTGRQGGFVAGSAGSFLTAGDAPPFQALICYEIIFSARLWDGDARPGWIVNVTNDAWFGDSAGPRQHILQARLRAVEEGIPVIRAANTGISAVIDPYGRVLDHIAYGHQGVIDTALPAGLPEPVAYRYGRLPLAGVLIALAIILMTMRQFAGTYTRIR